MSTAYIALGSNLGDRRANLERALDLLRAMPGVRVTSVSSFHETAPVACPPNSGDFLNAAAEIHTDAEPAALLGMLHDVERRLGRERNETNSPRTIDLDLLLMGDLVIRDAHLQVPHPRMHERRFVLAPLAEIAPGAVNPVLRRTVADLLQSLEHGENDLGRILRGRRALVTGSTSGIGRAIAETFARAGADVLIHGRRSPEAANEAAVTCRAAGVRSGVVLADLRLESDVLQLADEAWRTWGGVDVLVCNAGADTLTGAAAQSTFEEKLQALWEVDVRSTIQLARLLGERMRQGNGGVILTMGWDQAETGMEGDSGQLFAAVKGAVMAFTRSLALSLAPKVRVNCLAPGWIKTAWGDKASDYWQQRVTSETPLGRWGTPQDVARCALWLASPAAEFLTGQTIRVNGGAIR